MEILIIEDDKILRRLYAAVLEEQGWHVTHAEDGRKGLRAVTKSMPDVILLDLLMPKMDGFAFLDELHKNPAWIKIPIIVMTAKDLSWEDYQHLDQHVARIFRKSEPGALPDLVPAIRAVVPAEIL